MSKEKIIFLTGATATGKTALAIDLVAELPLEIISVDSAMVYQGMDIGTGKPTKEILAKVHHHLINTHDPADHYSCGQFREDALKLIKEILTRGKIPLLVGGTMLYFKALREGLSPLPKGHSAVLQELKQTLSSKGSATLYNQLAKLDPDTANRIHPNDSQRILRALEIFYLTGTPLSTHINDALDYQLPYEVLTLALTVERKQLHQRIEERFHLMLTQGFIEEVHQLLQRKDIDLDRPSLRAVGYRQIGLYLKKAYTYEEMIDKSIAATRQLAKRQITWLRAWPQLKWISIEDPNHSLQIKKTMEIFIN